MLPHIDRITRPSCPKCEIRMGLMRIQLGESGQETRWFECPEPASRVGAPLCSVMISVPYFVLPMMASQVLAAAFLPAILKIFSRRLIWPAVSF